MVTFSVGTRCAPLVLVLTLLKLPSVAGAGPVNINSADATTIAHELKGIGLKRAQAIVEYRSKHGPFKSADELGLVKGIGPKAVLKNKPDIRIDKSAPVAAPVRR